MIIPETPAWARARMDERGINPSYDAAGQPLTERYFDLVTLGDARRASGVVDDLDAHAVVYAREAMLLPPPERFEQYCAGAAIGDPTELRETGSP